MKKLLRYKRLSVFLLLFPALLLAACTLPEAQNETHLPEASAGSELELVGMREPYTQLRGDGQDSCTLMVYIIGADLEEDVGAASKDIQEMLDAKSSEKLNLILQTGGAEDWEDSRISGGKVQRWQVQDGQLLPLADLGRISMAETTALADFICFCSETYPADRYGLIFWDHGGGSLYGFGSDELFNGSCLYLHEIDQALDAAGLRFDFVGFDSCLMASLETAFMLEPHADYLIASEENEPQDGWDYTPWLDALAANSSLNTIQLGKEIIDSYNRQNGPRYTLSLLSLREIPYLYVQLGACLEQANALDNEGFRTISTARAEAKSFGDKEHDMVDLADFLLRSKLEGSESVLSILNAAVKYRNDSSLQGVHGLSFYFPYQDLSVYSYARSFFQNFGFGGPIYRFFDRFANVIVGAADSSGPFNQKSQSSSYDYSQEDWYDPALIDGYAYEEEQYTNLEVLWSEEENSYILPLSKDQWALLTDVQQQVLLDDGEGYVDLGSDQYFETTAANELLISFDNTWLAIDGQVVPYYAEETIVTEEKTIFTGYVPAVLNGETEIDLMLQWDSEDADAGYISGYRYYDEAEFGIGTVGRGLKQFQAEDVVEYLCDYYSHDGEYQGPFYWGEALTIGEELPPVSYRDLGGYHTYVSYQLTDIYQNQSWTELVEFYTD